MSELPSGWSRAVLPELVSSDGVFSDGDWVESKDQDPDGDVRLIQLADVGDGYYRDRSARFLTLAKAYQLGCTFLQNGDVLIARMPDPLGRACRFPGDAKRAVTVVDVCIMRPGTISLNPRWLMHTINAPQFRSAMTTYEKGTTRRRISRGNLARIPLPIPPLAEQERIVAAIEEQFSRLDAGVAALERVRQNLSRMRDAIRFAATLGQLVLQDADDEPAASLIARVKPTGRFRGGRPLPSDLGPLPPGWGWALMGSLAHRVTVGHVGPMKDEYVDDGVPFLRSQNVREDRFDPGGLRFISASFHERLRKSRLTPGDLVIVRSGNVGTACVVPESLEEANCADLEIVQRPEALDPHYAALYMNSLARARVHAGRVGVALTHFNTQSVAELPVPVPPMNEQKRIVAKAQRLMSVVDSLEADLIKGLRKASALRSSILASAFSGRLVAQDPTEESASILLKRIAAERPSSNGNGPKRGRKPRVLQEEAMT